MIPDTIEIDLAALKFPENIDRRTHIAQLLRVILFSEEVTPTPDEDGNWVMDYDWDPDLTKITMRKKVRRPHHQR